MPKNLELMVFEWDLSPVPPKPVVAVLANGEKLNADPLLVPLRPPGAMLARRLDGVTKPSNPTGAVSVGSFGASG